MRTICSMAAGFGLAVSVFAAPIASALPGEGPVAVQCQVYADNNFGPPGFGPGGMPGMGFGMKQWAGTVIGPSRWCEVRTFVASPGSVES
ncbi:Hypothetical protein ERS075547_00575 [Mycobacteroides abscessus]|nr:Hypothetical protein ERS075547_00575 [Mycobacteroides abscessus]